MSERADPRCCGHLLVHRSDRYRVFADGGPYARIFLGLELLWIALTVGDIAASRPAVEPPRVIRTCARLDGHSAGGP